jgi:hypothetical protein
MLPTLFDEVQEVRRLELRPGDIIVLRLPEGPWRNHAVNDLAKRVEHEFPGHKCIVLGPGIDIGVMGPE